MPVEIISLKKEDQQDCYHYTTDRQPTDPGSTAVCDAPFALVLVAIKTALPRTSVQRPQKKEQQRYFDDEILDAFRSNFQCLQERALGTRPTVEWTRNCRLPPGVHENELKISFHQREHALEEAFIGGSFHVESFFNSLNIKLLYDRG